MPSARLTIPVVLAAALVLGACAQTKDWLSSVRTPKTTTSGDPVLGAPQAEEYLRELELLSSNDLAAQAEIYADARAAAQLTPNPSTRLRYALVLATPGHPESDPQAAQSLLREVLSESALMTASEIALANIHLAAIEERIVLENEARRLRANTSRAAQTQQAALNERIANVESENRALKRELDEANAKLEAITSIERSIREQEQ